MRKTLAALALSLAAFATSASALEIAVSPARFMVDLDDKKRRTHAMEIVNTGGREVEVNVELANFDLDENNEVREIPPTEQSLDQWIAINPTRVVIPPQSRRTMRFAIRPQVQPTPGEHRAMIFLNEGDQGHDGGGVSFRFRLGVVVYAQVGPAARTASLGQVALQQRGLGFQIENTGNAHARFNGVFAVWDAASYPGDAEAQRLLAVSEATRAPSEPVTAQGAVHAGILTQTPVMPGARRTIVQPLPPETMGGGKRIFMLGKLGDAEIARSFSF